MGVCIDNYLRVKFASRDSEMKALEMARKAMLDRDFDLSGYEKSKDFEGLMEDLLYTRGRYSTDISTNKWRGFHVFKNYMESAYGYPSAIASIFEVMAPYLQDGSKYRAEDYESPGPYIEVKAEGGKPVYTPVF